jgi:hypothetical protein
MTRNSSSSRSSRADLLVTRDGALLEVARHRNLPFRILAPGAM